jgi:predicted DNA-binding protein (UPF0251 family)
MPSSKEQLQTTYTTALEEAEKVNLAEMTKIEEGHKRAAHFVRISHALATLAKDINRTRQNLHEAVMEGLEEMAKKSPEEMMRENGKSG